VALVRTDVSEELSASIIRVTTIDELGTLAVANNTTSTSFGSQSVNTDCVLTRPANGDCPLQGNRARREQLQAV
jgi:hypothetical protein